MNIRLTRGKSLVAGAAFAIGLGVGSVAWACVANYEVDSGAFVVTPKTLTPNGDYKSGHEMRAVAKFMSPADWVWKINLRSGTLPAPPEKLTADQQADCGKNGTTQGWAISSKGSFDWSFPLITEGQKQGRAYFCAIPRVRSEIGNNGVVAFPGDIMQFDNFSDDGTRGATITPLIVL